MAELHDCSKGCMIQNEKCDHQDISYPGGVLAKNTSHGEFGPQTGIFSQIHHNNMIYQFNFPEKILIKTICTGKGESLYN